MTENEQGAADNTTDAVKAAAEPPPSPHDPPDGDEPLRAEDRLGLDEDYKVGTGVNRKGIDLSPERQDDDPVFRPLRIYTIDPGDPELDGSIDVVNVPFERLQPGPVGRLLEVDSSDPDTGVVYPSVNLDDPGLLIRQGLDPTPADPRFHQQMVYAVCSETYAVFQRALGRELEWGFEPSPNPSATGERLRIRPFGIRDRNAGYDKAAGTLDFGYFRADDKVTGVNLPGGFVFTSLSHDVVVHEMTHALLDGLRSHFAFMSGPDVAAFHEGFADLIAIFQHFSYKSVVRESLRRVRGKLHEASLLTELARQFGHTTGSSDNARPLRSAITPKDEGRRRYDPTLDAHALGSVLVSAVFEAFTEIYEKRTRRYVLLATDGTGTLKDGEIPIFLLDILADQASKLAEQFLSILIRAVDYCPPVDLQLGEFLRAIITADRELVTSDPLRYRATITRVFGSYGLYPPNVRYLSEDELRWKPPEVVVERLTELTFARLRFRGDPGHPASQQERKRQAYALGRVVSQPRYLKAFGLAAPNDEALNGDVLGLPCIESVRTARRIGPDGQVQFDLIAEVTQRRDVRHGSGAPFEFYGGSTIIIDPAGGVRYVIGKSVLNEERLEAQRAYVGDAGRHFWPEDGAGLKPSPKPFALLHQRRQSE
jgi:hypothetical protein